MVQGKPAPGRVGKDESTRLMNGQVQVRGHGTAEKCPSDTLAARARRARMHGSPAPNPPSAHLECPLQQLILRISWPAEPCVHVWYEINGCAQEKIRLNQARYR